MSNVIKPLAAAAAVLTLSACSAEEAQNDQNIIVDINQAGNADIEAVPLDETVDPLPADNKSDPRSPEERGDGDEMVNIIDDTGNRS